MAAIVSVNTQDQDGLTALHNAAKRNDVSEVKNLLSLGAYVDVPEDENHQTPLHLAALESEEDSHFDTIKLLLENGADHSCRDDDGRTPLHDLVLKDNVKTIRLLLNHNADVHAKSDSFGSTPLNEAVFVEKYEIVKLLIEHGSDVNNHSDEDGSTPLHEACRNSESDLRIVKFLMKNGADVNAPDFKGRTPLMNELTCDFLDKNILKFLLKYSDVNIIDEFGNNILFLVENRELLKIVLEHIAKLRALDLPVSSEVLKYTSRDHRTYFKKCTKELTLAKSTKIENSWITFFDVLVDGRRKLKNYAGNKDLVESFESSKCKKKFPIYGKQMKKNMEKGIKKRELFDESSILLSSFLPVFNPDHLILRNILDCVLSTKDLSKLCEKIE